MFFTCQNQSKTIKFDPKNISQKPSESVQKHQSKTIKNRSKTISQKPSKTRPKSSVKISHKMLMCAPSEGSVYPFGNGQTLRIPQGSLPPCLGAVRISQKSSKLSPKISVKNHHNLSKNISQKPSKIGPKQSVKNHPK